MIRSVLSKEEAAGPGALQKDAWGRVLGLTAGSARAVLSALCALLLCAPAVLAQERADGPEYWAVAGVSPTDALNLRTAPTADSEAVYRIPYNARGLKNYGCPNHVTFEQWLRMTQAQRDRAARSRWCEVEYQGRRGWVSGRFLREDRASAAR